MAVPGITTDTLYVHLLHPLEPEHLTFLREQLDERIVTTTGERVPPETHILIAGRVKREHITPNLRAIITPFAGVPHENRAVLREFPQISVHNLHHNAPMTAEMAITLLLTAARGIIPADRALRNYDWTPRYSDNPPMILDGKTALILGYGAIGQRIGAVLKALGMTVLATKRSAVDVYSDGIADIHPAEALHELLPRANVLMIALPDTVETNGLIGAKEIHLLPKSAILVNVGRGAIVDQGALYAALCDKHLHSIGLDVWYRYPTDETSRHNTSPADYPFGSLENVVLSPHRGGAGGSDEVERRRLAALADSLNAAVRGEAIPHRIDLERGY